MALTTKNQLLIAYKKLVGKAHTNAQIGDLNEPIGSNIQLDTKTVFAETIPTSASNVVFSITSGTVEKLDFDLVPISLSQYTAVGTSAGGITADGDGAPLGTFTNGVHAFKLKLPADYVSNSSNSKKGTQFFLNGQILSDTGGRLQIVPPRYGNSYKPIVSSSSGIISELNEENYYLDTYAGILFLQDINRVPTKVSAHLYVGNFLDQNIPSLELPKLIVSSSVSLTTTQRAVFATNMASSSISITLPSASLADSREYYVIKADSVSGSVDILPSSPNLINGTSSFQLNGPFQSVTLIHDGTDWYVF
jgi:hypothetical protein